VFSGDSLSYQELAAWAQLKGIKPTPDEVAVIRYIDRVFWRVQTEGANGK
jgi:hypothetical protein